MYSIGITEGEISMENQIVKQEQGAKWLDTVYNKRYWYRQYKRG